MSTDPHANELHRGRDCTYIDPNGREVLAFRDERYEVLPSDSVRSLERLRGQVQSPAEALERIAAYHEQDNTSRRHVYLNVRDVARAALAQLDTEGEGT